MTKKLMYLQSSLMFLMALMVMPAHSLGPIPCNVLAKFPHEGSLGTFVGDTLKSAQKHVRVALYGFNNPVLADELIQLAKRNVFVEVKIDAEKFDQKRTHRLIQKLTASGVKVQSVAPDGRNHNKFAVIDGEKVVTGSYNWTVKAERNFENLIVLDCRAIAQQYERAWERIR